MKDEEKIIRFPAYGYTIIFVKTKSIVQSRIKRNKEIGHDFKGKENDSCVDGLHSYSKVVPDSFIFLHSKPNIGTLSHECYHAVCRMFRWINAKKIDEEVFAYHLGYLIEEAHKFFR